MTILGNLIFYSTNLFRHTHHYSIVIHRSYTIVKSILTNSSEIVGALLSLNLTVLVHFSVKATDTCYVVRRWAQGLQNVDVTERGQRTVGHGQGQSDAAENKSSSWAGARRITAYTCLRRASRRLRNNGRFGSLLA